MKIALGSTSEAKKEILKDALKNLVTENIEVFGFDVESGITDQPLSEAVTIEGAMNRAKNAMGKASNVDFAVGLEGGLENIATRH
jgi:non-canonical (house-cleaning) NTP pyrophosphatase